MKALPAEIAKNWFTLRQAQEALGDVCRATVYNLCDRGLVKRKTYLRRAIFSRDSIATFVGRYASR